MSCRFFLCDCCTRSASATAFDAQGVFTAQTEGKNGTKVTYLYFNATEDPNDILRRYMKDNGIPNVPEYVSQLQTKILSVRITLLCARVPCVCMPMVLRL